MNKFLLFIILTMSNFLFPLAQAAEFSLNDMAAGILDLTSDQFEFDNLNGIVTYTGNVDVTLGDRHLKSDQLIIYRNIKGDGEVIKIVAKGKPAHLQGTLENQPEIIDAYANEMEYDIQKEMFYLRGDARVVRGKDVYEAPEIQYDVVNEIISSASSEKERTHITIDANTLKKSGP
jgi:lipopolysaccharide export system protein LptA